MRSARSLRKCGCCLQDSAVDGVVAEHLLDAQQLVVLADAVGAAERAGLDLAGVGGHGDVGDGACPRSRRSGG